MVSAKRSARRLKIGTVRYTSESSGEKATGGGEEVGTPGADEREAEARAGTGIGADPKAESAGEAALGGSIAT